MSSKILVFVILLRWGVGSNTARSCPHGTDLLDRSAPAFLLDRRPPVSREYAAHDTLRARAHRAWRGHKGVGKVKPGQHRPQGGVLHPDLDRIGPRDLVAKSQHLGDAIAEEKPYEAETDKAILNSTPAWERQARTPPPQKRQCKRDCFNLSPPDLPAPRKGHADEPMSICVHCSVIQTLTGSMQCRHGHKQMETTSFGCFCTVA